MLLIGNVAEDRSHEVIAGFSLKFPGCCLEGGAISIQKHDACALGEHPLRRRGTDASGSSGNDCDLAGERFWLWHSA